MASTAPSKSLEPDDVADYSRQSYWVSRYSNEAQYDWFMTVQSACVDAVCDELAAVFNAREATHPASDQRPVVRVLHLGTGNSKLCADLYAAVLARALPFTLEQVAMDYAPNVIERMRETYPPEVLPNTQWVVGDVRCLEEFAASGPFDAVIDKGTMDAIMADKNSKTLESDIVAMLRGVSDLLAHAKGYGIFLQISWVVPYLRLQYTQHEDYAWGENVRSALLGESDIYRTFVYTIK